jgi:ATP-binding cassette subfamily A (ABC1) protein 3
MPEMRKMLGVCPQHDVLFDYLTPKDHLRLFATFKGVPNNKIEKEVHKMLLDIGLIQQQDQLAKTLSGGQKRKLSVAIALIGDSKIVMLDEPTSGMDTTSRRKLWDMLKRNKQGRIIILTTHYMDEADILGDRIAIMAEGRVQCTGSSLFLKNRYGVGYNLVISKKSRGPNQAIDRFIQNNIKDSKKLQEVSSEVQYQLPTSSSGQFKEFFKLFDQNLDVLGINSYGVGITTLEEVFLQIGHGKLDNETKN